MTGNLMPASFPGTPFSHNGHGILVFTFGDDLAVKGHGGGMPGHVTWMAHDEQSGTTAALFQNSCANDMHAFQRGGIREPFEAVFRTTRA